MIFDILYNNKSKISEVTLQEMLRTKYNVIGSNTGITAVNTRECMVYLTNEDVLTKWVANVITNVHNYRYVITFVCDNFYRMSLHGAGECDN